MTWNPRFKLGQAGNEIGLLMQITAVDFDVKNVEQLVENLLGDKRRTILKANVPLIQIAFSAMPNLTQQQVMGFFQSLAVLNLLCNDSLKVKYQFLTANAAGMVVLPNTSATGITIDGVFLQADVARQGTNYFTGGSFDPASLTITLGTNLPSANEPVFVDYSFTGHKVMVTEFKVRPHEGQYQDLWRGTIKLEGA